MLKKFDVYIIKKYLTTFFFTMCLITLIACAMNFFENIDRFLADDVKLKGVLLVYFPNFIPWINGLLWPLFSLIAVIFFTSRMARDSEIIAALSSGMTYNRILRPFLITGFFLAFLHWIGNNYIIPNSNKKKNEFESTYIKRSTKSTLSTNIHFYLSPNEKLFIRFYNDLDSIARSFRIERFENGKLKEFIKCNELRYQRTTGKWKMVGYEMHKINDLNESMVVDKEMQKDTVLALKPEVFVRYAKQMEMLTSNDLRAFMNDEKNRGLDASPKYKLELYRRTADPFTIIILTVLGVTIASRKVRGGMGLHLAMGIILGAIFVILSKFSLSFATNLGMPPGLGVWVPNIIFTFVSYYLYSKAQK
jgi:lipopolysaccharide export system permease protein